jgi:3-oxoacyl-[acyl-carrier protein] reductase
MKTIDLSGKTAIVTGSGQGIGKATATALYQAGANVLVNYFPDSDGQNQKLAETVCTELGERCDTFAADVRNIDQLIAMNRTAKEKFGSVDILVNNAGILRDRSFKKMSSQEWQDVIDTNLTGVFNSCKASMEFISEHGRIINIASLSAVTGFFGQANYAAAKAGVMSLTKVLSKELARMQITVNAVAPGVVMTEMGESIPEENRKAMLANVPLNRFAQPEEIANVILFLSSGMASYITGQTIHVNGGWWG